jgi:hypothetical protein
MENLMKAIFALFGAIILAVSCSSIKNKLLIIGTNKDANGNFIAGYWENQQWYDLKTLNNIIESESTDIVRYKNDIYISGYCIDKSNKSVSGYWKNSKWFVLPAGFDSENSMAECIFVNESGIFVGGYCIDQEGNQIPGYWKNGQWVALPNTEYKNGIVNCIIEYKKSIYCGGSIMSEENQYASFWENGVKQNLQLMSTTNNSGINSITVFIDDVIPAGFCINDKNISEAGYWKKHQWIQIDNNESSVVNTIKSNSEDLYFCGTKYKKEWEAGYWEKSMWYDVENNEKAMSQIYDILINDGNIYCTGFINTGACYWINNKYYKLNSSYRDSTAKRFIYFE